MFVELSQGMHPESAQSIRDNIAAEELPDAPQVVAYLNAGHPLIDMMDIEDDPLEPGRQVLNGSSILTDGEWLWRLDFGYYVRRHRVVVPPELLASIREHDYVVPDASVERLTELAATAEKFAFGPNGGVPFPSQA
ncbi:hypothetical protein Ade02nite_09510 [Paractinoplanes deccanensis]|uniref:Uncharacterized protein n=1 Tax=Paractinoplanes deccanensis TaxID=113561 RepID=A0ABQ3XX33_9ACTN|nr:hypothetical protein [Actinoplanes deccanensis]GID72310.1 hypothetical protein Ade02nite_09510 [Actinoplanes deccanensis]